MGVFLLLLFIFLWTRFAQIKQVGLLLKRFPWEILIGLVILLSIIICLRGMVYLVLYRRNNEEMSIGHSVTLYLASYTIDVIAPSAGLAGIFVFVGDAAKRGLSRAKALAINLLYYVVDYINLALMVLVSLIALLLVGKVDNRIILASVLFAAFMVFGIILAIFILKKQLLTKFLKFINNILEKFWIKKIPDNIATGLDREGNKLLANIGKDKLIVVLPWILFLLISLGEVLILYCIFWGFGVENISIIGLVTGYIIGLLFITISITPAGIGIAEPIMVLLFISLVKVSADQAVLAVLVYRAITTWLPLVPGVYCNKKLLV